MNISDWSARSARVWGDRLAVVDTARPGDEGRFTFVQIDDRARRIARYLRDVVGVRPGDRVGMLAHNGVEYVDLFCACGKLGATFVPFNWRQHWRELGELFERIEPKALIFSGAFAAGVRELATHGHAPRHLLHLDGDPVAESQHYETVLRASPRELEAARIDDEAIACLMFTGGTTGLPKAAKISWRQIAYNVLNTVAHEVDRHDVTIIHTPMFHTGGLLVHLTPLLVVGGTSVLMPKWTADAMLELLEREKVTMLFAVPTQWQLMMESPRFRTTSFARLRFVTAGGAAMPVPVIRAYREAHGVTFKQGFGMTEFGPGAFSMGPEYAESKAGSIGKPNYFVEARVVDDANAPLPQGEAGELVLRGPVACSGYFGDEGASRASVDDEGWFHTGDVARVDEQGFFFIVDRKKDMFISGGENVYPIEVEKALYEHPAVGLCAVIGVADPKWGEVGRAVVVKKSGAEVSAEALIAHCAQRLAKYKVPKDVIFAEAIPMTPAGKLLKRELRELYGR